MNYKEIAEKTLEKVVKHLYEIDISECSLTEIEKIVAVLNLIRLYTPCEHWLGFNSCCCSAYTKTEEDNA